MQSKPNHVLCINAQLFPDTICPVIGQDWLSGLLQFTYTCNNDSIQYRIENIGTEDTDQQLEYIIIEDAVLLIEGDINNLPLLELRSPYHSH